MRNKTKILSEILSIVLIFSIALNLLLMHDNKEIQIQIEKRDKLIEEKQANDSLLSAQTKTNEKIIEKYIDDCGIFIDGRKVKTDELLLFINNLIKELNSSKDSLEIYKVYNELVKKNLSVNFKVKDEINRHAISMEWKQDSLVLYKNIVQLIERDYGIKYLIEKKDNYFIIKNQFSKADSAKIIFEFYKDKLHKNDSGDWVVVLPEKIKLKP